MFTDSFRTRHYVEKVIRSLAFNRTKNATALTHTRLFSPHSPIMVLINRFFNSTINKEYISFHV